MSLSTSTFTNPLQYNTKYLGMGALGGLLGTYMMQRWNDNAAATLLDTYQLESAAAGFVTNWIVVMAWTPDTSSTIKGLLIGWAGAAVFNRLLRGTYQAMKDSAASVTQ